jgi:hypothetical protein
LQKTEKQTYQARVKAVEEMIDWAVLWNSTTLFLVKLKFLHRSSRL